MLWHALRSWQLWPDRFYFSRCCDMHGMHCRHFCVCHGRLELHCLRGRHLLVRIRCNLRRHMHKLLGWKVLVCNGRNLGCRVR